MIVYQDKLLRRSVVVEDQAGLWLVPRSSDGWRRRLRLTLTAEARAERLKPAKDIDAAALGVPSDKDTEADAARGANGLTESNLF